MEAAPAGPRVPLDAYQKRLVVFLSVATFFEGYDFFALAQLLPELRREFGLEPAAAGWMIAVINVGTVVAGVVVRLADTWGRRRVLALTIAGYTLASLATAMTGSVVGFALAQLVARAFLIGEWAVAMIILAEEYPADRRATVIGIVQASASLGGIVCAAVVPLLLQTSLGWRAVYVVGAVPLVIVAIIRRGMRETRRFTEQQAGPDARTLLAIIRGPYRRRVALLGLIWALTYVCCQSALTFWKEFAVAERSFTNGQIGMTISIAALAAMPLLFGTGRLLDVLGRRMGGAVVFSVAAAGVVASYTLHSQAALTVALVAAVFGTSSVLPVLNAYTTELFPTALRSGGFALANNVLGRAGFVLAPIMVGEAAGHWGYGLAVAVTAVPMMLALALILTFLPETRGQELEATSAC